jgi:hypothetical protein
MKPLIHALALAVLALLLPLAAQEPSLVNSNGEQIDTAAEREAFRANLQVPGLDVQGQSLDVVNSQPWCMAKVSSWNTASSPPLRLGVIGDSLSEIGGPFGLGPMMGFAGLIGLQTYNVTGTVTNHGIPSDARPDIWINGKGTTFEIGSSAEFTSGGSATGNVRGDRACIAYVAGPGKGAFDLQWQANGAGAWTTLANINTANASTIGVIQTYNLPTTNFPFYRLRVTNVTGGIVELAPLTGIYNSTGGGVIFVRAGSSSGLDLATHVAATPAAVFDPIWAALDLDCVVSIWADAAAEWNSGGAFRAFYTRATAANGNCDWIQISRNPSNEPEGIPYSIQVAREQAAAQRAWAFEFNQTFLNGHEIHGGSWTVANARGLMSDDVHLSSAGATHRNACLWPKLPLGNLYLQGGFQLGQNPPRAGASMIASNFTQAISMEGAWEMTGILAGYRMWDRTLPLRPDLITEIFTDNEQVKIQRGTAVGGYFDFGSGRIGFYPGGSNWALGNSSTRWKPFFAETNISGPLIQPADSQTATTAAVSIVTPETKLTTTAPAQAITLANGTDGQTKTIMHVATSGGGTAVLTPTTKTGFSTITFTSVGDVVTLKYYTTLGWMIHYIRGATAS